MSVLQPKQLKLLMTADEIMAEYQPLDADRAMFQQLVERGGEHTDRPRRTDMGYNDPHPEGGYVRRMRDFQPMSVEETWAQKRREADESGLTESVQNFGVVWPVPLGDVVGLAGKPQITGGHHRIAAAMGGDQFIGVIHHQGLKEGAVEAMKMMGMRYR